MSPGAAPAAGLVPWWVTSRLVIAGRLACRSRHLGAGGNMRDAPSEMRRTARGAQHGSAHFSGQHGGSTARAARRSIHQSSSPLN